MKKLLLAASLLAICVGATAQTFTVANDDGVMLSYSVTSADDQTVALTANNYTGRVVVPETVLHNDTLWTVTSIGTAFQGSSVTYVSVPASVITLAYRVFGNCMQLDTVWFASEEPVVLGNGIFKANRYLFDSRSVNPPLVVVPCGSLQAYRSQTTGSMAARLWNEMPNLTSPCAVPFRVIPTIDSICRVDSVWIVSNSGGASLAYSNRDYEVGDTAFVMAQRWVEGYNSVVKHGYFIGWSNGNTDPSFQFCRGTGRYHLLHRRHFPPCITLG